MAQTASQEGIAPRSISFKATLQVLAAFQPVISQQAHRGVEHLNSLYQQMYTEDAIAARLGCGRRTVARQLALIRTIWRDAGF